jgi:hypothetical protein
MIGPSRRWATSASRRKGEGVLHALALSFSPLYITPVIVCKRRAPHVLFDFSSLRRPRLWNSARKSPRWLAFLSGGFLTWFGGTWTAHLFEVHA